MLRLVGAGGEFLGDALEVSLRFDEFVEGGFIELSDATATNLFDHKNPYPPITQIYSKDLIQPPSTWIEVPVM